MGRPSEEKALEIARQLCLGLAAAHENGVLHRDLKPANIMIDGRGRARITDFGLAGLADDLAGRRDRAGTPAYMAPEQLADGKVSVRSDIFALGLVLHEVFTGKRAYDTNDVAELKRLHSSGSFATPSSGAQEIDEAVRRIIDRCLERDPQQRPQSVYAVLGALPGSDPLAAALAAGETPSPELVANARDAGGLRPPIAIGLLVAMLAFLAITYFIHAGRTVMPERSPAVLSVVAEQVMEELGYVDLPRNSVSGYNVNTHLSESLRSLPRPYDELAEMDWPPPFRFWRRWTRGDFLPVNFHFPEVFTIYGLTTTSNGTATVALDSTGRLLGLLVGRALSRTASTPVGDIDWSPVFQRANLDESDATPIPLVKSPPVYCDEVAAWRMGGTGEGGDPVTIQMGAVGGRPNYLEILGLDEDMVGKGPWSVTTAIMHPYVSSSILIVMFVLAWRNLRASRGDRRNAFRCALLIGGLYALMEVLSMPPGHWLSWVSEGFGRGTGHVLIHALQMWVMYMAIEPYVRRVWPRMLVGLVRLLSGRLRDPAVGREVLIGVATGCGLVAVLAMTTSADWLFQADEFGQLPFTGELRSRLSPVIFLSTKAHRVAWTVNLAANIATWLIAIRLLTRHTPAALVLGIVMLGATVVHE
jgi:serine/threonine-protein kinase